MNTQSHMKLKHYRLLVVLAINIVGSTAMGQMKVTPHSPGAPDKIAPNPPHLQFEVISIRPSARGFWGAISPQRETTDIQPDGYRAVDQPLIATIAFAYLPLSYSGTPDSKPLGQPNWSGDEYDIQAKVALADIKVWQDQGPQKEMLSAMLRSMLEDRFKLAVHWIPGQTQGFALVVAKHGPKLKSSVSGEPVPPNGYPVRFGNEIVPGATCIPFTKGDGRRDMPFYNISMQAIANWLSANVGVPVLNQTGLSGNYDLVLHERDRNKESDSDPGPSFSWDLEEMGLKVVPSKVLTKRLVIDHIERPSAN